MRLYRLLLPVYSTVRWATFALCSTLQLLVGLLSFLSLSLSLCAVRMGCSTMLFFGRSLLYRRLSWLTCNACITVELASGTLKRTIPPLSLLNLILSARHQRMPSDLQPYIDISFSTTYLFGGQRAFSYSKVTATLTVLVASL